MPEIRRVIVVAALLLAGGSACHRGPAVVPAGLAQATRVVLRGWEDADPRRPYVLTRRDSITALARFVRGLRGGWAAPPAGREAPTVRAEFFRGAEPLGSIGLTSFGDTSYFVAPRGSAHLARRATAAEVRAFTRFFGIVGTLYIQ